MTAADLASRIQHTLYDVGTTELDLDAHCQACVEFGFAAAMIPARFVGRAVELLAGTGVLVATAVDFPVGLMTDRGRIAEAEAVVAAGAQQIDLAVPIGLLRTGHDRLFEESIAVVVRAAAPVEIKVMLELPLLSPDEAERAVALSVSAGAMWLKNASSGAVGVATPSDIRLLRERAPQGVRVKASGGIHTARQVSDLIAAGADLVGTSSGVGIVTGQAVEKASY